MQLLERQFHKGIGMAVGGGLIVLFGFALIVVTIATPHEGRLLFPSIGGWIGGFILIARGSGMSVRARTSKRELEKRCELPTARVVEK